MTTAKELGLPSGYRLTTANMKNIKRVVVMKKFKKKLMDLAWKECDLMVCMSAQMYDRDALNAYVEMVRELSGKPDTPRMDILRFNDSVDFLIKSISPGSTRLGGYVSHYNNQDRGITTSRYFTHMVNSMTHQEFLEFNIPDDPDYDKAYQWKEHYNVVLVPRDGDCRLGYSGTWRKFSSKLKKRTKSHMKKCFKLIAEIEKYNELINSYIHSFSSTIKLCADAPEFVVHIQDASAYNKYGRKCTDVGTADMLQEIRNS